LPFTSAPLIYLPKKILWVPIANDPGDGRDEEAGVQIFDIDSMLEEPPEPIF